MSSWAWVGTCSYPRHGLPYRLLPSNWYLTYSSSSDPPGYSKCILVSHDWGALLAWNFSIYYPSLVDRMVVVSAAPMSVYQGVSGGPGHWMCLCKGMCVCVCTSPSTSQHSRGGGSSSEPGSLPQQHSQFTIIDNTLRSNSHFLTTYR